MIPPTVKPDDTTTWPLALIIANEVGVGICEATANFLYLLAEVAEVRQMVLDGIEPIIVLATVQSKIQKQNDARLNTLRVENAMMGRDLTLAMSVLEARGFISRVPAPGQLLKLAH